MDRLKHDQSERIVICLALLLLIVCMFLAAGKTFGRYQWEFSQVSYQFSPAAQDSVAVYGGSISQEMIDSGSLPVVSSAWEQTDSGAKLDFSVTNGSISQFAQRDQIFCVRIAAGLAAEDPQQLTILLSYTDESGSMVSVTGIPVPILEGSFQHSAFGDGWVYRFYSGEEELSFALKGGSFDYQNFTVTVTGDVPATLLDLQVTGQYTD